MNKKIEVLDATDNECMMVAAALHAGSKKTIEELILEFRAAKSSPAGLACSAFVSAEQADRDLQFAEIDAKLRAMDVARYTSTKRMGDEAAG